jgi:hypothetical protein
VSNFARHAYRILPNCGGNASGIRRVARKRLARRLPCTDGIVTFRTAPLVVIVIVIALVTSMPIGADSAPAHPRLRLPDRRMLPVVQAGRDSSPSFRALIERLETTDVVVYVQCARLRSRLDGELTFLAAAGGLRYVSVRIAWDLPLERRIAVLGHELRHALEVADNPDIVSAGTMALAYERFGFTRNRGFRRVDFDTMAAIDTGVTIARELADRANGD